LEKLWIFRHTCGDFFFKESLHNVLIELSKLIILNWKVSDGSNKSEKLQQPVGCETKHV